MTTQDTVETVEIVSRDGTLVGRGTETELGCPDVEGCMGTVYRVAWPDGEETYCCAKGMQPYKHGWKII